MPAVFHPRSNLIARGSLFALAAVVTGGVAVWVGFAGSAYDTGETLALWQPVPFSHAHHAGELGIDCRYCHSSVETAASAGMPSTDVCMNCHWQLWTEAEILEPVRTSWREGRRVAWNRVYELPDFVYFEHSVHVSAGISCVVCHGDVDRMPLVYQAVNHTMDWCLDCHRDPLPGMAARPLLGVAVGGAAAGVEEREPPVHVPRESSLEGLTSCSACHR